MTRNGRRRRSSSSHIESPVVAASSDDIVTRNDVNRTMVAARPKKRARRRGSRTNDTEGDNGSEATQQDNAGERTKHLKYSHEPSLASFLRSGEECTIHTLSVLHRCTY